MLPTPGFHRFWGLKNRLIFIFFITLGNNWVNCENMKDHDGDIIVTVYSAHMVN
ncbi:hypothetical protein VCHA47P369_50160 [Vibrio chagasii]|nr:hypothetical protein VCHA48P435_30213 [Vibrio chagasii]CAH7244208.1 hypothetical protein VCHA47P369_50160 [Vibrio chagasii]CAH7285173.1 hypothetical protein VCHA51O448_40161 [Vibrio chagasii]